MESSCDEPGRQMDQLIAGESLRRIDERYRVSIPPELVELLAGGDRQCILAKERPGCLSLWNAADWKAKLEQGVELVQAKVRSRRLDGRLDEVQRLGRLLSTRHRNVQLGGRGRLALPEGFREFLEVEPGSSVMVVGAAVCVEIWHPERWNEYIREHVAQFRQLLDQLVG